MFKDSLQKYVVAVTGGGSLFISDRLTEGGASRYLVYAVVPYDQKSLEAFTGGLREKACSCCTARQMAVAGEAYAAALGIKAIGIGATCSLSKGEGEREGRIHSIFVAAKFGEVCVVVEWTHSVQRYTRLEEEKIAAHLIKEVAEIFGKYINNRTHLIDNGLEAAFSNFGNTTLWTNIKVTFPSTFAKEQISSLTAGANKIGFYNEQCFKNFHNTKNKTICVYPGSFSLVHDDHIRNFRECELLYGKENCFCELSISNYEKQSIDSIELTKRVEEMRKMTGNIILTNSSLFKDKIHLIRRPGPSEVIFCVGFDTFQRIEQLGENVKFLVFPRNGKRVSKNEAYSNFIKEESYSLEEGFNLSSSSLRKA